MFVEKKFKKIVYTNGFYLKFYLTQGKAEVLIDSYFYNKAENPSMTEGLVTSKAKLSLCK